MMLPSKWMTLRMKAENGLWMARGQPCCCLQHHCYSCNAKEKTRVLQKTEDEVWFMMSGSNTATFTANFVFETCEQKKTQQYCTVLYKYDVFFRCLCNNSSCWHLIGHTFRRTRINKHPYVLENKCPNIWNHWIPFSHGVRAVPKIPDPDRGWGKWGSGPLYCSACTWECQNLRWVSMGIEKQKHRIRMWSNMASLRITQLKRWLFRILPSIRSLIRGFPLPRLIPGGCEGLSLGALLRGHLGATWIFWWQQVIYAVNHLHQHLIHSHEYWSTLYLCQDQLVNDWSQGNQFWTRSTIRSRPWFKCSTTTWFVLVSAQLHCAECMRFFFAFARGRASG